MYRVVKVPVYLNINRQIILQTGESTTILTRWGHDKIMEQLTILTQWGHDKIMEQVTTHYSDTVRPWEKIKELIILRQWDHDKITEQLTILTRWGQVSIRPCTLRKSFRHSPITYSVMMDGNLPSRHRPKIVTMFLWRWRLETHTNGTVSNSLLYRELHKP